MATASAGVYRPRHPERTVRYTEILYFNLVPFSGFRSIIQDGELMPENSWRVPCAWRVVVESGKVTVWQLYANQCALHEIYDRIRASDDD